MNGFSIVEKLKELEKNAEPGPWIADEDGPFVVDEYTGDVIEIPNGGCDAEFITDLRNAAPLLLDMAGQIQPEDAIRLKLLSKMSALTEDEIAMLKRYQKMAERMHEDHH